MRATIELTEYRHSLPLTFRDKNSRQLGSYCRA